METKDHFEIGVNLEMFTDRVAALIPDLLDKKDFQKKINARRDLVLMGKSILPDIYMLLNSNNMSIKREAAKIIQLISDKDSIPILIRLLEIEDGTLRWIAAKGLIRIGRESIVPLLETIIETGNNYYLKLGTHHVLSELLTEEEKNEMKALLLSLKNHNNVAIAAPVEAFRAKKTFSKSKEIKELKLNLLDFINPYNSNNF
jgi:HEAT repeat protein